MPDDQQFQGGDAFLALIAHNERVRRRRARKALRGRKTAASAVIAALLAGIGLALAYLIHANDEANKSTPPPPVQPATTTATAPTTTAPTTTETSQAAPPPSPTRRPAARTVNFEVFATRGPSWVEIRERTQTGKVLFSGIVEQHSSVETTGTRLWVRFGSVGSLDLWVNGKRVHPQNSGTIDAVVTASGLHG
jgi:RodZ C-terminal domain